MITQNTSAAAMDKNYCSDSHTIGCMHMYVQRISMCTCEYTNTHINITWNITLEAAPSLWANDIKH